MLDPILKGILTYLIDVMGVNDFCTHVCDFIQILNVLRIFSNSTSTLALEVLIWQTFFSLLFFVAIIELQNSNHCRTMKETYRKVSRKMKL